MKKRTYPPKRVKLPILLLRTLSLVLVLSLAFAWWYWDYLLQRIKQQGNEQITENLSQIQRYISEIDAKSESELLMQNIQCRMAMYTHYDIMLEDPLSSDPNQGLIQLVPWYSPGCSVVAALVDEHNNIAASNREILLTHISFEQDGTDNGFYVCDKEALLMPEVDQLYADYHELNRKEVERYIIDMQLTSAYVNKKNHTFIPHEGIMAQYHVDSVYGTIHEIQDSAEQNVKKIHITIQNDDYELIELHQGPNSDYPRNMMFYFHGEKAEEFEPFKDKLVFQDEHSSRGGGGWEYDDNTLVFSRSALIYAQKQPYWLCLYYTVNFRDPQIMHLYWKYTILFAAALTIIALLWCWRKNVVNKAKYAFEDYQHDLTDHLAHDIKTPLMAIGGYAENIIDGKLTDEEQQRYLHSILDNVAFTDSIITRTLFLNSTERTKKEKRETLQVKTLLDDALGKYALLLDEKHITYGVQGSAEISTERNTLETIIENLISNAVKYTPENGVIECVLDKKHLLITNTVTEQVHTKDLKRPFVRGDAARSNTQGSGLGLSIADRTALAGGYKLSISCTEAQFKAELRF